MKSSKADAHAAKREPAAPQEERSARSTRDATATPGHPLQARVDHSPRMQAQRDAIEAAFAPTAQRQPGNVKEAPPALGKQIDALRPPHADRGQGGAVQERAARSLDMQDTPGPANNRTGMPDGLRDSIESLSGMDLSDVRVHHNSSQPAQLNALAYAQGNDIHLGPGQERHLPHEAWHVVQQRQGRVQATMQMADVGVNDDEALEKEADVMGERAVQRRPSVRNDQLLRSSPTRRVVQREVKTHGGTFQTSRYEAHYNENVGETKQTEVGADIKLKFTPDPSVLGGAQHIGLTQTVKSIKSTPTGQLEPFTPPDSPMKVEFKLNAGEGDLGRGIDVKDRYDDDMDTENSTNPMYGVFNKKGKVSKKLSDTLPDIGFGPRNLDTGAAELYDKPRTALDFPAQAVSMQFEATAIILEGALEGSYLGSIAWGWEKAEGDDARPLLKPTAISKLSDGIPTSAFLTAARKWNEWNGGKRPSRLGEGDLDVVKLPIPTLDPDLTAQEPSVSELAKLCLKHDELLKLDETEESKTNISNLDFAVRWLAGHLKATEQDDQLIQQVNELADDFNPIKSRLRYELKLPLMMNQAPVSKEREADNESSSSDNDLSIDLDDL